MFDLCFSANPQKTLVPTKNSHFKVVPLKIPSICSIYMYVYSVQCPCNYMCMYTVGSHALMYVHTLVYVRVGRK